MLISIIGKKSIPTKRRMIEIKCPKCRIKRTDAALRYGFDFLEEVAVKAWNQRVL